MQTKDSEHKAHYVLFRII